MKYPLTPEHAAWLENTRGLSLDLCARFGLMSRGGEIGMPYFLNGALKYVKWRRIDKSAMRIAPAGESPILYNLDELSEPTGRGQALVITEGELDCIAVAHTGFHATSVPNGAPEREGEGDIDPLDDRRFAFLWVGGKLHPDVAKFDRVILFTDNDGPGRALANELAIRIGRHKCFIPAYPADCKDPNDILARHGLEELSRRIRDARPIVPDRLARYSELPITDPVDGLTSGWAGLDPHLRLTFPELVTVTGVPNAGKSQWTLAWVCNLARIHNVKTAIIQLEDSPARNKADLLRYASAWAHEHGEEPEDWVDDRFVTKLPPEALDEDEDITLEWIRNAVEESVLRHNCKIVLLDPWNEIEHAFSRGMSETQYTNDALREIKRLTRRYQITIIVVTHPTKSIVGKDLEDISLYDVSGSSAWNNKSDHGIIIFREEGASETQVKVAKCKHYAVMGRPGIVTMRFNPRHASFEFIRKGI